MADPGHNFSGQAASGNARQHVGNNYNDNRHEGDNIYYTTNYNGIPVATDAESQKRRNKALIEAARRGYTQRLRALLKSGVDVDYVDQEGRTALRRATNAGFVDGVQMLIEAGSDVNCRDEDGDTPLMMAALNGSTEIVHLYLRTPGIDVCARNSNTWTAVHWAAGFKRPNVVKMLAQHGCNLNEATIIGDTPLRLAVKDLVADTSGLRTVEALVKAGAHISLQNGYDETPLQAAQQKLNEEAGRLDEDRIADMRGIVTCLKSLEQDG